MLKLIIILVLLIYLLNKISVVFFGAGRPQPPPPYRNQANGSIRVDDQSSKTKKNGDFKGGEYIDYEEVK